MLSKKCLVCSKEFTTYPSRIKVGKGKYCSKECYCIYVTGRKVMAKTGNKAYNWKGDKAGYSAVHKWVIRHKGYPHKCVHCEKIGKRINKYWNIDWANIDHKYYRNINDYIGLCRSCHAKYDLKNNLSAVGNNQYTKR